MSEQTSQEPTMEEILASIRRIISEDDAAPAEETEAAPAAAAQPEPVAEPVVTTAPEPEPVVEAPASAPVAVVEAAAAVPVPEEEDALELTEKVETLGDLDVFATDEPAPTPAPAPGPAPIVAPRPAPMPVAEVAPTLVSAQAATAAAMSFGALSAAIAMPRSDRTLEDVVRELLRPMLQQWLDDNLPGVVQAAVAAEVERIARAGR